MKRQIAAIVISILGFSTIQTVAANATDFNSAPSNIAAYENKINQSLVEVSCELGSSVGFSGSYTITQEMKDKGQNSLILTTGTGIKPCRYSGSVQLTYLKKDYLGTTQWWNGQNPDFATVITSVNIPALPLFGSDKPAVGWWVDVVQNIKGFGLVWRQSKVLLYNDKLLYFMIDATSPMVTDNALVFNNQGTFIGVVTSSQPGVAQGQTIVQGAPLQCGLDKSSLFSPTNCGKKGVDIWVPGVVTPVVTALASDQEYVDVTNAISKSIVKIQNQIQSCKDIGIQEIADVRQMIISTSWWEQCASSAAELGTVSNNSKANMSAVAASRIVSAGDVAIQNTYYDQVNNLSDKVSSASTELDASLQTFISVSALKIGFGTDLEDSLAMLSADLDRIGSLPASLKTAISKSALYKYLLVNEEIATSNLEEFNTLIDGFSSATTSSDIDDALSSMQEIADAKSSTLFINNVKKLHAQIPAAYCKNGKIIGPLQKNAQCAKGWKKIKV